MARPGALALPSPWPLPWPLSWPPVDCLLRGGGRRMACFHTPNRCVRDDVAGRPQALMRPQALIPALRRRRRRPSPIPIQAFALPVPRLGKRLLPCALTSRA